MKILVIDDHPLIVEGIQTALRELDADARIVSAHDLARAEQVFAEQAPFKLVVLDESLPGFKLAAFMGTLRGHQPEVAVVVLLASDTREAVMRALEAGARGVISKQSSLKVLLSAIKLVLAGGMYIPAEVFVGESRSSPPPGAWPTRALGLTERQTEVLNLLVEGKPNKLICRELNVSEGTVKTHVSAILRALNVSNRAQVSYAISRLGLPLSGRGIKTEELR